MMLIGGLLILAVIADGVRRVMVDRRNVIRMGKSHSRYSELPDEDIVNPELPYGGARSVPRSEYDPTAPRKPVADTPVRPVASGKPLRRPGDPIPAPAPAEPEAPPSRALQPETPAGGQQGDTLGADGAGSEHYPPIDPVHPIDPIGSPPPTPQLPPEPAFDFTPDPAIYAESDTQEPEFDYSLELPDTELESGIEAQRDEPTQPPPEAEPPPEPGQAGATLNAQPDEVLIINVLSRDKNGFNGADLLEVLLACDVRFGDMDIFHRFEGAQGQGRIQFSIANLVKPGTFDLDGIKEFYTPGVCMFLQLPGPQRPLEAFDCMAEIATCIVKNLQGEMRDENHSVLTAQTMEHYRQRIREYERKRLMRAAHRSA